VSARKIVVYAGPTISHDEVRSVLPEAQVRPPVARGDLLREEWTQDDTAVIIDGYFRERLSVGHKEILWLLNEGMQVIGGASMGALRAAELNLYGMRGVGSVFDMYATGEVNGDDEVAVLHGPGDVGYPALTVAMINIRYGCREGAKTGLVPTAIGERIVDAAKATPFTHRTWAELEEALGPDSRNSLRTLEQMIGTGEWDLKRLDAMLALRVVSRLRTKGSKAWAADVALTGITHYEALRWRSVHEYKPGKWMSDLDVLDAARLFGQDYPRLHEQVLTSLLAEFADAQGLGVAAYACARLGINERADLPPSLASWLTEAELAALPRAEQLRLIRVRVRPVWQSTDWRPLVLERIRKSSQWPKWSNIVVRADEAAERARSRVKASPPEMCGKLFLRHWHQQTTSAEIEMARRGFYGMGDLGSTVQRFFALDVQNTTGSRGH
jgi:hypothetical protein